ALAAVRIYVVGDRRAAAFYRLGQNFTHGRMQAPEAVLAQTAGDSLGVDARAEQRLVGIDVADPPDEVLVQEPGLDARLAPGGAPEELVELPLERLRAEFFHALRHRVAEQDPAELALVVVQQHAAAI